MDLLPYCEGEAMIPVDLSANCEDLIYDPNESGIQILGIRSRIRFRCPRTCLLQAIIFEQYCFIVIVISTMGR